MTKNGLGFDFKIMAVVNITPDSFSDGGHYLDEKAAISRSLALLDDGADIIDLGAESTRPGALAVDPKEQWRRLKPVIDFLCKIPGVLLSVDCRDDELILRCLESGIHYVNNIDGLCAPKVMTKIKKFDHLLGYIAMHKWGEPSTMQNTPLIAKEACISVEDFFNKSSKTLLELGFEKEQIFLDPGIGFGKSDLANISLLAACPFYARKYNLCVGVSRKSFIGRLLDIKDPAERDISSKCIESALVLGGAKMIRTHEVAKLAKIRSVLQEEE